MNRLFAHAKNIPKFAVLIRRLGFMKILKQFHIPFVGLKFGKHQFEYVINDSFFAAFTDSLIQKGELSVKLELEKMEHLLILNFEIIGFVSLICDRCADEYQMPVQINERQLVKFTHLQEGEAPLLDDEIIYLGKKDFEIDISNLIYEYVNVSVPYVHIHPDKANGESGCNPQVLSVLKKYMEKAKEDDNASNDPRWNVLKNINNN